MKKSMRLILDANEYIFGIGKVTRPGRLLNDIQYSSGLCLMSGVFQLSIVN